MLKSISASIISANLLNIEKEINKLKKYGINNIHIDICDNHYAPTLTFGPLICKYIKTLNVNVETHLMIKPITNNIIKDFAQYSNIIYFHNNATDNAQKIINNIKKYNCKVGIVYNYDEVIQLDKLNKISKKIDFIQIMSVPNGFSGQHFNIKTINKIKFIKNNIDSNIKIQVDGGINNTNIKHIIKAGANNLVIGKYLFQNKNYKNKIKTIQRLINK